MEGVCIYYNNNGYAEIAMYKELNIKSLNNVLLCLFSNKTFNYYYVSCKYMTNFLPLESKHILTQLPYIENFDNMLKLWKSLVINRLKILNKQM